MATARESRRLRRASRGRGEAEDNGRREDDAQGEGDAHEDEQQGTPLDDSGGGVISTLKDTAADAALAVLKPVAKRAATKAAKFAVEKGPELFEDKVLPMVEDAGGPAGLMASLAEGGGPASALLSKFTGGGDDDDDGGDREAGDATGQGRRMPIQQAVDVAAPIEIVYDQFTQFEDWPRFMHRVESVEQKDESTVVFNEKIWIIRRRWEAEIVEQRPDERIVWESVSGTRHVGVVTFHELSDRLTRIEVTIDIDPQGPMEKIARGARFAKRAVRADLHRFKAFVEMHEDETGAWRGEIQDGEVVSEEGDEDERYEDDGYEEEDADAEAEAEGDEPEAEAEVDDEPEPEEDEEDEEPEAEAEEEPEAEAEEKPKPRSRSRSSSNGSSKSESAKPKQSRRSGSGTSRAKSGGGSTSRSRSRGSTPKSKSSSTKSTSSRSKSSRAKSSSKS